MEMKAFLACTALSVVLALPGAMAYLSTSDVTGIAGPAPQEIGDYPVFYVGDDVSVWQESNGIDGLQTADLYDEETGEMIAPADTLVIAADDLLAL